MLPLPTPFEIAVITKPRTQMLIDSNITQRIVRVAPVLDVEYSFKLYMASEAITVNSVHVEDFEADNSRYRFKEVINRSSAEENDDSKRQIDLN